jgi:hypothetical protein
MHAVDFPGSSIAPGGTGVRVFMSTARADYVPTGSAQILGDQGARTWR